MNWVLDNESAERVRNALSVNSGGFIITDLATLVGKRFRCVSDYLHKLREEGQAVYVPGFPHRGRWCSPAFAEALQATYDAARVKNAIEAKAKKKASRAKLRKKANPNLRPAYVVAEKKTMLLAAILDEGMSGMPLRAMCYMTGCSQETVRKWLVQWRDAGLIEKNAPSGANTRWGPPGIKEHYAEDWKRGEKMRQAYRRREAERRKEARRPGLSDEPLRVIVSALEASPLRPTGPASVWALGRAA